jgi:hypothetical protein
MDKPSRFHTECNLPARGRMHGYRRRLVAAGFVGDQHQRPFAASYGNMTISCRIHISFVRMLYYVTQSCRGQTPVAPLCTASIRSRRHPSRFLSNHDLNTFSGSVSTPLQGKIVLTIRGCRERVNRPVHLGQRRQDRRPGGSVRPERIAAN